MHATEDEDDFVDHSSADFTVIMRKPTDAEDGRRNGGNENVTRFLNGVEADPYLDVFYGLLSQVLDTPYQKTFFNVLQHLREIHLLRHPSGVEYVWETLEKFVCRLKLLRSPNEAHELLMRLLYERGETSLNGTYTTTNMIGACCCPCHRQSDAPTVTVVQPPSPPPLPPPQTPQSTSGISTEQRKRQTADTDNETRRPTFTEMISNAATSASQKSSNGEISSTARRSSDTSQFSSRPVSNATRLAPAAGHVVPIRTPPPPPPTISTDDLVVNGVKLLPQQNLPQPKTKLKTFPWSKLPASKIVENVNNSDNVWINAAKRFDSKAIISAINLDYLETLFAAPTHSPPSTMERLKGAEHVYGSHMSLNSANGIANRQSNGDSHSTGHDYASNTLGRRRDTLADINLLDPKRSLNVNIFLKQFRGGIDDLIELIATGDSHYLGLEKLRGLTKILPEPDELEVLMAYTGDKCRLGNAERFFLALMGVTNYRLRVESMLLKEEFRSMLDYIKPSVDTLIAAARDLKNSQSLQEVLYLLLLVGNYLNAGGYGGNAVGFKMSSLWKLVEIRANKPNVTLLHYVVAEIEKKNRRLLDLPKELKSLDDASKLSFDTILSDFRHLKEKTDRVSKQVAQNDADDEIKNQTEVFFDVAKRELIAIERDIAQVDRLRLELAAFFCEDACAFKLEEYFKIFSTFCQRFSRAMEENAERRLQEEKAEMRRILKEQQKTKKEFHTLPRTKNSETEPPRKLSDKYKSLLNAGDVLLPLHSNGQSSTTLENTKDDEKHSSLVNVLSSNCQSANSTVNWQASRRSIGGEEDIEFSPGSALWRRSYNCKRRGTTVTSSTFTNRERPREEASQSQPQSQSTSKPWRQRVEELMVEDENSTSKRASSSTELDSMCPLRRQSQQESTFASNVDKPVECSPIFAKTFSRRETARIASVNELDQCRTPSMEDTSRARGQSVEMKRSVWREQKRMRANSLLAETGENGATSANDLNELLEILKIENESNFNQRRRGSRISRSMASGSEDEANENPKEIQANSSITTELKTTDIDEVVRHCEKARQEIESMGSREISPTVSSPDQSCSPWLAKPDQQNPTSSMECSTEFTLSAVDSPDCASCNLVIPCNGVDSPNFASISHSSAESTYNATSVIQLPAIDQTPHLVELLDEGFEEDTSNSTNCSSVMGVQSPPLVPDPQKKRSRERPRQITTDVSKSNTSKTASQAGSSQSATKSVATTASQTKYSYQSGTKSSSLKSVQNSTTSKVAARSYLTSTASSAQKTATRRPVPAPVKAKVEIRQVNSKQASSGQLQQRAALVRAKPTSVSGQESKTASRNVKQRTPAVTDSSLTRAPSKARIQVQPMHRPSMRSQRAASVGVCGNSSSSGSDSEHRPSQEPAPRRVPPSRQPKKMENSKQQSITIRKVGSTNQPKCAMEIRSNTAVAKFSSRTRSATPNV